MSAFFASNTWATSISHRTRRKAASTTPLSTQKSGTLYVAHTANDAVDVIDCQRDRYVRSISQLPGVAGVLVSNEKDLVFTSNRGETSVNVFTHGKDSGLERILVGGSPNGLAFDPSRNMLLTASVESQTMQARSLCPLSM